MYRQIEGMRSVRMHYTETVVNRGDLSVEEAERALQEYGEVLRQAFEQTRESATESVPAIERTEPEPAPVATMETGVDRAELGEVAEALARVPDGFRVHPKLEKWLEQRRAALDDDHVDWSLAEALAFGTLLRAGITVRLTGQDTRRGTFSQRHGVLVDQETGAEHLPLQHVGEPQGRAYLYDSLLSEFAVVGFEYGYSVADPDALVLWEGQFGDFVNGAQVIVDQYLVAAEDKWLQTSGLVLLLPHGYEGQGPEHSSARLERFLELAAKDNIEVAVPSTAAQYFHLLRRQALRDVRKPLVVMTPKSLLRLAEAASAADDLVAGAFRPVLADPAPPGTPTRVVLCQGKLFYDLAKRRTEQSLDGVALLRLEQCYPFPDEALRGELDRFGEAELIWAQEEPENMGAGRFVVRNLRERIGREARMVARRESPSPATGSLTLHKLEQERLAAQALEEG
jgi:2-oxoglutarate dehydrogenase complex dehydrogenase (E1) component-like enzyme